MTPDEMDDLADVEPVEAEVADEDASSENYEALFNIAEDTGEVLESLRKLDKREPFMTRNLRLRIEGLINEINGFLGYEPEES